MNFLPHRKRLSRRGFLGAAAFATGAACCWADEGEPGSIDAHVHVWTSDTDAYPLGEGFAKSEMQPLSFTPDELLAQCRPVGVDRVVLIQMSFYRFDNRYLLDAIAKYPSVFRGVAIIDHKSPEVGKAMRQLQRQGIAGFRLYATAQATGSWIDSREIAAMWTSAAETGQAVCLLANPDALPAIERLCKLFPRTRVVIDHFARIGMDGTIRTTDLDDLCRLAATPQIFVRHPPFMPWDEPGTYLDLAPMISPSPRCLRHERLMWGERLPVPGGAWPRMRPVPFR